MPSDLLITIVIVLVGLVILHFKSHLKFIILGIYIGVVLAETVALSIFNQLAPRFSALTAPSGFNYLQLTLLLLPTLVLGINHSVEKKRWSLVKKILFMVVAALLITSSVMHYLPVELRQSIVSQSIVAFQINQLYIPLLIAGAAVIMIESFHHKRIIKQDRADAKVKKK